MVRDLGYDAYGLICIVAFLVCCFFGIDKDWNIRFTFPVLTKERVWFATSIIIFSLWQIYNAVQELAHLYD